MIKLDVLYKLKSLIRYNTLNRIKDESVAEHMYFTAIISMQICHQFNIPEFESVAIKAALMHDIPELWLSDVPHDVKENIPTLKEIIEKEEAFILAKEFCYQLPDTQILKTILKLADIKSVMQYVNSERQLGNHSLDYILDGVLKEIAAKEVYLEHLVYEYMKGKVRDAKE